MVKFRTAHGKRVRVSHAGAERGEQGERLTGAKQAFRQECNINSIMDRYQRTGVLPMTDKQPQYVECPADVSYQSALNQVIAVQEAFMQLPPGVRRRFNNDPEGFVEFVSDPANADEAEAMGLLSPEAVAARQEAREEAERQRREPDEGSSE